MRVAQAAGAHRSMASTIIVRRPRQEYLLAINGPLR